MGEFTWLEWSDKIPKRQMTSDQAMVLFSSYTLSVVNDKLYFFYNDHPKNLTYDGEGNVAAFRSIYKCTVVQLGFDMNGNKTKKIIKSDDGESIMLYPSISNQCLETDIILLTRGNEHHQFIKVEVEK